jgi:hypothetical protein
MVCGSLESERFWGVFYPDAVDYSREKAKGKE